MRKTIFLLIMLLAMSGAAMAQGVTYSQRGNEAQVTGCDINAEEVTVEAYYGGKKVTAIASNAFLGSNAKVLNLPQSIEVFENGALYSMRALERITTPLSLKKIGKSAFGACMSLQSVWITANVSDIDGNVFALCGALSEIGVDANNTSYASYQGCLYTKDFQTLITCPAGKEGRIEVHSATKTIAENAFSGCEKISEVVLPDGLEHIKSRAFFGCEFNTIKLPTALKTIENAAFSSCQNLEKVYLPSSVYFVDAGAFLLCRNLTDIKADSDNINYFSRDGLLYSTAQNALALCPPGKRGVVYIPSDITAVGDYSLSGCPYVESVVVPQSVQYVSPLSMSPSTVVYGALGSSAHYAAQNGGMEFVVYVEIILDSKKIKCLPRLEDGVLMIPVRAFGEALGASVGYNAQTNSVTLKSGDTSLEIASQSTAAVLNGKSITLDCAARVFNGVMYAPLRLVAEGFGCSVEWVNSIPAVIMTTR